MMNFEENGKLWPKNVNNQLFQILKLYDLISILDGIIKENLVASTKVNGDELNAGTDEARDIFPCSASSGSSCHSSR